VLAITKSYGENLHRRCIFHRIGSGVPSSIDNHTHPCFGFAMTPKRPSQLGESLMLDVSVSCTGGALRGIPCSAFVRGLARSMSSSMVRA
jgi:hypothetical protein